MTRTYTLMIAMIIVAIGLSWLALTATSFTYQGGLSKNKANHEKTIEQDENGNHEIVMRNCPSEGEITATRIVTDYLFADELCADKKFFRIPNPNLPGTDIVYACVEGPEAAAYLRGTATLVNGQAFITFPDHFTVVAADEGLTVQLTPCSFESRGLAVVSQSPEGISVRELYYGTGDYDFHWEAKAIRKGHENYRVIRPQVDWSNR